MIVKYTGIEETGFAIGAIKHASYIGNQSLPLEFKSCSSSPLICNKEPCVPRKLLWFWTYSLLTASALHPSKNTKIGWNQTRQKSYLSAVARFIKKWLLLHIFHQALKRNALTRTNGLNFRLEVLSCVKGMLKAHSLYLRSTHTKKYLHLNLSDQLGQVQIYKVGCFSKCSPPWQKLCQCQLSWYLRPCGRCLLGHHKMPTFVLKYPTCVVSPMTKLHRDSLSFKPVM